MNRRVEQSPAQVARQKAALRRAKLGERCIVFAVAGLMAVAMLPVVLVIASGVAIARAIAATSRRLAHRPSRRQVASARRVSELHGHDKGVRRDALAVSYEHRRRRRHRRRRHGQRRRARRARRASVLRRGLRTIS